MIKVVICDGKGAVGLPSPSAAQEIIRSLPEMQMQLAVATNDKTRALAERTFLSADLTPPSIIVTRGDIGVAKGSPLYVERIAAQAQVGKHEIVYIGDDDKTDSICALNSRVLLLSARYSNPEMTFGLPMSSPDEFLEYLKVFGMQPEPYFGWTCRHNGSEGVIDARSLICDHHGLTNTLKDVLKPPHTDTPIGSRGVSLRRILLKYLISHLHMSGVSAEIDYVTLYPGSKVGKVNKLVAEFSQSLPLVFKERFLEDLIIRHLDAPTGHLQQSADRNIYDQFRTIKINDRYRKKILGRKILVLDDFTRDGNSLETARQMLLAAGANRVVGISFAKFKQKYWATRIVKKWDPYQPCSLAREDVASVAVSYVLNPAADLYFSQNVLGYFKR